MSKVLTILSNLAIVLYSDEPNIDRFTYGMNICKDRFSAYMKPLSFFYDVKHKGTWWNLFHASVLKRGYELNNNLEFDAVFAINVDRIESFKFITVVEIPCQDDMLYYFYGKWDGNNYKTIVLDYGFYASSRIFNIGSLFGKIEPNIETEATKGGKFKEHGFNWYLKSLNIKLTCCNSSDLVIL